MTTQGRLVRWAGNTLQFVSPTGHVNEYRIPVKGSGVEAIVPDRAGGVVLVAAPNFGNRVQTEVVHVDADGRVRARSRFDEARDLEFNTWTFANGFVIGEVDWRRYTARLGVGAGPEKNPVDIISNGDLRLSVGGGAGRGQLTVRTYSNDPDCGRPNVRLGRSVHDPMAAEVCRRDGDRVRRLGGLSIAVDLSQLPFAVRRPERHPDDPRETGLEFIKMLAVDPPLRNFVVQLRVENPHELSWTEFEDFRIHQPRYMDLVAWIRDSGELISYLLVSDDWDWCAGLDRACLIKWKPDGAWIKFLARPEPAQLPVAK